MVHEAELSANVRPGEWWQVSDYRGPTKLWNNSLGIIIDKFVFLYTIIRWTFKNAKAFKRRWLVRGKLLRRAYLVDERIAETWTGQSRRCNRTELRRAKRGNWRGV